MAMRVQGPGGAIIEFPDGTDEATIGRAMMQLGAEPQQAQPQQQPAEQLGSVFQQFPNELRGPTGNAAIFGASDAQMGDIIQKQLGDKFIRREPYSLESKALAPGAPAGTRASAAHTPGGEYEVMVTRGANGNEQRGFVNQPGLDREDISRAVYGSLPYALTGGAAGGITKGMGLVAQALGQGVAGGATSMAGDVAQIPLGSEQGIEGSKAAMIAAMGGVIPLAGRAAGNAMSSLKDRLAPQTGPLQGKSPKAVRNVEQGMSDARLTPGVYQHEVANIGPEAMLGDMGTTLRDDTAVLAATPGAKDVAVPRLRERQARAPQRIESTLNENLGPEINLPQYQRQQSAAYQALAAPHYRNFYQRSIPTNPGLDNILRRIPERVQQRAQEIARTEGNNLIETVPSAPGQPPIERVTPRGWDYYKRATQDLIEKEEPGSQFGRALTELDNQLRARVDDAVSPGNPAASPWARGRATAGEGLEGDAAAARGAQAFGPTPRDPHMVADDLANASAYGQDMYRAGGRNKIRQIMGRASSNFGPKGDTAARRALNSEFSRENLDQIAGPHQGRNITRRIDAENTMAELHDLALGNSKTDRMQAARKKWAPHTDSDFASQAGKKGPSGLATETLFRIADKMLGGQLRKAEARAALDGANILSATGGDRDRIFEALFKHVEARKTGRMSGPKFERTVKALLGGARVPAMQDQR